MTLQTAISLLMQNDKNATWDECETISELRTGLTEAMKDYDRLEDTFIFYNNILINLNFA